MPMGVFEHIIDYIPPPRVWENSLIRLNARAKLSPLQAIQDTSALLDEMLCDCRVFTNPVQKNLLVKLSRSPSVNSILLFFCYIHFLCKGCIIHAARA